MPIATAAPEESEWINPDNLPDPVITFGFDVKDFDGYELALHRHAKNQFIFLLRGALSCEVHGELWVVPPGSAIWIASEALHSIKAAGTLLGYHCFVDRSVAPDLPDVCRAMAVTPLLRELLVRSAELPTHFERDGADSLVTDLLLAEIAAATQIEDLHLPMPTDPRIRKTVEQMIASPADRGNVGSWAKRVGMSERTFRRVIGRQTGMSFGRWRQQLGLMLAVQWLAGGATIQQVAVDLGYESASSFVTMFTKALGTSPGRYMAERRRGQFDIRIERRP